MLTKTNTPPGLTAVPLATLCRAVPRDQTNPFLQNKPNFKKVKMRLTRYGKSTYDVWTLSAMGQNKPKQSQFPPPKPPTRTIWPRPPISSGASPPRRSPPSRADNSPAPRHCLKWRPMAKAYRNILIIKPSSLGDLVLALPAVFSQHRQRILDSAGSCRSLRDSQRRVRRECGALLVSVRAGRWRRRR